MEAATPETTQPIGVDKENKPAATLVSGFAALGTLLAAAGITEGVVPRMVREQGTLFGLAVGGVLLAGLFGVIAGLVAKDKRGEKYLLIASNVLLLLGLFFGMLGAIAVWNSTRVPTVTATPGITAAGTFLDVTVKDTGLDSREHVTLLVEPLHVVPDPHTPGGTMLQPKRAIYTASFGSDDKGEVDQKVRVRLPDGYRGYIGTRAYAGELPKGCYADSSSDGCISSRLFGAHERPQLKTRWGTRGERLGIFFSARQIYRRTISLRVVGRRASKWHEIAAWRLAPALGGSLSHGFWVRRVRRFKAICVVASTSGRNGCPPRRADRDSVWFRYRIPEGK